MSKRSTTWPRIDKRTYPTGRTKYVVDLGIQNGTRARKNFDTRGEAEAFAQQARAARYEQGEAAFFLPRDVQAEALKLFDYLKPYGIRLDDVRQHYEKEVIPYFKAPTVTEVAQRLMDRVKNQRRATWCRTLGAFLAEFTSVFGNRKITDIKESELKNFCFKPDRIPPYSPGTRRSRRALASQLYNFAIEKNWAAKNLANGLDTPPVEDKEPEYLKVDDVARLLAVAEEFDLLGYLVLALFLGVRPNEIRQLDWSDVNVADGFVIIYAAASKIHERREIPINPTAAAWLVCCQRSTGPVVGSASFESRFRMLRRAAGINNWPKDIMRHSFASYHASAFKNPEETARQMGHIGGLRILRKHYVAYVPEDVANQFWALRPAAIATATDKKAA